MPSSKGKAAPLVLAPGTDGSLLLLPRADLDAVLQNVLASPFAGADAANFQRLFFSRLFECSPDGQGRILVPPPLQAFAGLKDEVTFVGVGNRVEIWSAARWASLEAKTSPRFDKLARASYAPPMGANGAGPAGGKGSSR